MNCSWAEFPDSSLFSLSLVAEVIKEQELYQLVVNAVRFIEMIVTPVLISADPP